MSLEITNKNGSDTELELVKIRIISFIKKFKIKPNTIILGAHKYKYNQRFNDLVNRLKNKYIVIYTYDEKDAVIPALTKYKPIKEEGKLPF